MNIKNKLKNLYLPINTSSLALFLSVLAIGYVASATNTPCLQAQSTCAIGGDNEFTGNISLKGNTTHSATIKVDPLISGDIELTLPNQTGTLALVGSTLAGSKIVATDINGDLTTNSYLPTGIGTAGQFLKVNPGATALIYADISEVPTLTNNAPYLKVNGTGEIDSSATLTADSPFLSVDGSGQIQAGTSTADAPFVKIDASGQLDSSATLTADSPFLSADANGQIQAGTIGAASTPLKSDANSQIVASDLDITTDITPGSALQEIRVNASGTALEYFTPGGAGIGRIVASGTADSGYNGEHICWQTGSMPFTTNPLDQDKEYRLMINWTENHYNAAIANGGAYNLGYQLFFGDDSNNVGRQCDSTTSGNNAYGRAGWHWNTVSNRQPGTCAGSYYRMEGTSSSECRYQNGYSPNYWVDATCNLMAGSMPSSISSAYDYLSFDKAIIDFSSQKNGIGVSQQYTVSGGFNSSDTTNSNYKATFSGKGSCNYGESNTGTTFESFAGIKLGMWNGTNQVYSDIEWVLIEYN